MKNSIILMTLCAVFALFCTNAFANTGDVQYVRVSQVYCDTEGYYQNYKKVERVVVELTEAGKLYMEKHGYKHVVVQVVPKFLDFRSSEQVTISKKDGYNTVSFEVKSERSCGKHDFTLKVVSWI